MAFYLLSLLAYFLMFFFIILSIISLFKPNVGLFYMPFIKTKKRVSAFFINIGNTFISFVLFILLLVNLPSDYYKDGIEYLNKNNYLSAIKCFEKIDEESEYFSKKSELIKKTQEDSYPYYLNKINNSLKESNIDEAVILRNEITQIIGDVNKIKEIDDKLYNKIDIYINNFVIDIDFEDKLKTLNNIGNIDKYKDDVYKILTRYNSIRNKIDEINKILIGREDEEYNIITYENDYTTALKIITDLNNEYKKEMYVKWMFVYIYSLYFLYYEFDSNFNEQDIKDHLIPICLDFVKKHLNYSMGYSLLSLAYSRIFDKMKSMEYSKIGLELSKNKYEKVLANIAISISYILNNNPSLAEEHYNESLKNETTYKGDLNAMYTYYMIECFSGFKNNNGCLNEHDNTIIYLLKESKNLNHRTYLTKFSDIYPLAIYKGAEISSKLQDVLSLSEQERKKIKKELFQLKLDFEKLLRIYPDYIEYKERLDSTTELYNFL